MIEFGLPAIFVLFVWWFSTGAVIYLNNLPKETYQWSFLAVSLVLGGSIYGLYVTSHSNTIASAYLSFTFGLLAWAWTQFTFFTGLITGPRTTACPSSCKGPRHFWHAVETQYVSRDIRRAHWRRDLLHDHDGREPHRLLDLHDHLAHAFEREDQRGSGRAQSEHSLLPRASSLYWELSQEARDEPALSCVHHRLDRGDRSSLAQGHRDTDAIPSSFWHSLSTSSSSPWASWSIGSWCCPSRRKPCGTGA